MRNYDNDEPLYHRGLKKIILVLIYVLVILIIVFIISVVIDTVNKQDTLAVGDSAYSAVPAQIIENTPVAESDTIMPTNTIEPTQTPKIIAEMDYGHPEDFGFSLEKLDDLDLYIQEQVDDGFPGAVIMIAKDGHIVFHKAYGYSKKYDGMNLMDDFEPMETDTMFDLASLTKIYSATFSIMKLVDDGLIKLDGKVSDYLPGYTGSNKDKVTVAMLLQHSAGYTNDYSFYKNDSSYRTFDRNTVYNYALQIPLDISPGAKNDYNNLNYILLGMIVEEVSGMRIDEYAREKIYKPLGIEDKVTYRPMDNGIEQSNIAATERLGNTRDGMVYFDGIRQYTIRGEVHDENTFYCMDQVSGHAGLFATSYGLTVLNQVLLNEGEYDGVRIYKEETINNWLQVVNYSSKHQLGFWSAKIASSRLEPYVSDLTFYHNGWTGTATIVDRENELSIILLTNKRHSPCPDGHFEGAENYNLAKYVYAIQKVYKALDN